jgi:hypothetical protein
VRVVSKPASPDLLAPEARTDYRALEANRTTLGQWDLQYTTGPRAGQYFEPTVTIVNVARYAPWEAPGLSVYDQNRLRSMSKGNELLLTLEGRKGVLPKRWIIRPTVKRQIAQALGSFVVQDWPGKQITIYFDPEVRFGKGKKAPKVGGLRAKAAPGHELPTAEPLDNPVDDEAAARIDAAVKACFDEEEGT